MRAERRGVLDGWAEDEGDDRTWFSLADELGLSIVDVLFPDRQMEGWRVDGAHPELVAEMRASPLGPHSRELQELLFILRTQDLNGRYVLLVREPGRRWQIGRVATRGVPVVTVSEGSFGSLAEAEWEVFRLRWREHTGLEIEERQ